MIDYRIPLGALTKQQQAFDQIGQLPQQAIAGLQQGMKLGEMVRVNEAMPGVRQTISEQFASGQPDRNVMLGALAQVDPQAALNMAGFNRAQASATPPSGLIEQHRTAAEQYRAAIQEYLKGATSDDPSVLQSSAQALEALEPLRQQYNNTLSQMSQYKGLTPYMVKIKPVSEYLTGEQDRGLRNRLRQAQIAQADASVEMLPLEKERAIAETALARAEQSLIPTDIAYKRAQLEKMEATAQEASEQAEKGSAQQIKNAGFVERMISAHNSLNRLTPPSVIGGAVARIKSGVGYSDDPFLVAASEFITPNLRDESGAAIGQDEFANADARLIPKAGDSPATLQMKKRNRENIIKAGIKASGPAYTGAFGGVSTTQKTTQPANNVDPLGLGIK